MANVEVNTPLILAPAGNKAAFLAALAAGADAIYCGLKHFSARMEAKNFTLSELKRLTRLAHARNTQVYVTLNTLVTNNELDNIGQTLAQLTQQVRPDAVIVQDLSLIELVRQTGFKGEVHLSTLANAGCLEALQLIQRNLQVARVVVPRELNIDEIKQLAQACPPNLKLEVFIHGALCYGVSGRCYWSSYLGGKSGLRGRCVQPCRRRYTHDKRSGRLFACQDLSLDVLVKVLKSVPAVNTWKIEGRKKGPHYVYYTVQAYRLLRDQGHEPQRKREALSLLAYALGRDTTHYNFLPQRPQQAVPAGKPTGSGLLIGRVRGGPRNPYLIPREALLRGDVLRIGYEDDAWHQVKRLTQGVPAKGKLHLRTASGKPPHKATPVFLVDRRDKDLNTLLGALEQELEGVGGQTRASKSVFQVRLPQRVKARLKSVHLSVYRQAASKSKAGAAALWLMPDSDLRLPPKAIEQIWWWLPPVTWPGSERETADQVAKLQQRGAQNFVLNTPWQIAWFAKGQRPSLWAGPFCNIANVLAIEVLRAMGFMGVIVSPELHRQDYLALPRHSPLPLGVVVSGNWPLCISRTLSDDMKLDVPFTSPKGEQSWVRRYGPDYWVYPNWRIDLQHEHKTLVKAGYAMLVDLQEPVPRGVKMKTRPGQWNWRIGLQ
jgi:putative protease